MPHDWRAWARQELAAAYADRAQGNEGRARVRARRIAGAIAEAYLRQQGETRAFGQNALRVLEYLWRRPEISPRTRLLLTHFLMRVNTQFQLPPGVDLLEDVQAFAQELLGETLTPAADDAAEPDESPGASSSDGGDA